MNSTTIVVAPAATPAVPAPHSRPTRRGRLWLVPMMVAVAVVYAMSATWSGYYAVDPLTNVLQARAFADHGTAVVDDAEHLTRDRSLRYLAWMVESPRGTTTQYPPGVGMWGALFYLADTDAPMTPVEYLGLDIESGTLVPMTEDVPMPALAPATAAAVVSSVLAVLFLGLMFTQVLERTAAQVALLLSAMGTGLWSVASDRLWQHGPAAMFVALGAWLAGKDRLFAAGLAFGGATMVRPHLSVIAAGLGLFLAFSERRLRPALLVGAGCGIGMALLFLHNYWMWGTLTISGGYGDVFTDRAASNGPIRLASNLVQFFVHHRVGILVTSSFLIIAFAGLRRWRRVNAPPWAVGLAIGALAYTVLQMQANRVTGGSKFFGYRYPIEPLVAAAPLLAMAGAAWVTAGARELRSMRVGVLAALGAISIAFHGWGAVYVW